jgi:hypothetical protein
VSFVGKTSVNANAAAHSVALPAGVTAGDGMLLFATANSATATINDPAGWTLLRQVRSAAGITTKLWQRRAGSGEPATVNVTLGALAKTDVLLLAYRGTAPIGPVVAAEAGIAETAPAASHVTPGLTTSGDALIVSYWADNSSATTAWTEPAGVTVRSTSFGTGGGQITSLAADSGGPVAAGTHGGLVGTANSSSGKATMWTVALSD